MAVLNDSTPVQECGALRADETRGSVQWFALRDLKRSNAKLPAYIQLSSEFGLDVFTPLKWSVCISKGRRVRKQVPFVSDLLFVRSSKEILAPIIESIKTLQFRYLKGGKQFQPITVRDVEMDAFITAVKSTKSVEYYLPSEVTTSMIGKMVCIVGGPLDGYVGNLLSIKGLRKKRFLIGIPSLITASVEVEPEYIRFV